MLQILITCASTAKVSYHKDITESCNSASIENIDSIHVSLYKYQFYSLFLKLVTTSILLFYISHGF